MDFQSVRRDIFSCCYRVPKHTEYLEDDVNRYRKNDVDGLPYIDSDKEENILIIRKIEPCIELNGPEHHTSEFELMKREFEPQLVIRRGQPFKIDITLSRPYNEEKDGVSFIFAVDDEEKPTFGQGTLIGVPLLKKSDKSLAWSAILESTDDSKIRVKITTPHDCVIGKWRMDVDTKIINEGAYSYSWSTGIYVLFNPWNKKDIVYMKNEEWRNETVLNDVGLIWRGTANRLRPCVWKYSQFEKNVLECSLYLITEVGKVRGNAKSDPIRITRALAAAVNSIDDEGAIEGNWSDDYSGGIAPYKWIGSLEILQKYYKKKKPVKYGQCWVFSGVLATICRAIGIPARVVTNYSSAHDTQSSMTVDYFMDENGSVINHLISDSIWNYHVWDEVWMERPDLGKEYGGWQAIDATPQEPSDDMYRCGPTSVFAVKQAEVLRPYDCAFLFAEVNADKVYWKYSGPTQPLKLLGKDINSIGKFISTKAAGKFEREDITHTYKHNEKSVEERAVMLKALRQSENLFARYYLNEDFNDIQFHFELKDDIKIGQPFDVSLVMTNKSSSKDYKISVILRVDVVTYTGKNSKLIKKDKYEISVKAACTHEVKLNVKYEEYFKQLIDQCSFNISCLATVEDTKYEYYAQDDFRVRKPDIKINLPADTKQGQEVVADVYLENPLPIAIKKGEFTISAPGVKKNLKVKVKNSIPPAQKACVQFKFTPPSSGKETIAAKFSSKELDDVDGFLNFVVHPMTKEGNGNAA